MIGRHEMDNNEDSDDFLNVKITNNHIKPIKIPIDKFIPINPPRIVATPLPPLNFNHTG